MARSLEIRIRKLEQAAGGLPCTKPGHNDLFVFVKQQFREGGHEELDPDAEARIASIRACEKCKNKAVVIFTIFGREAPEQVMEQKPKGQVFDFVYGEEPNQSPRVVPAPWLNGILTIGDD